MLLRRAALGASGSSLAFGSLVFGVSLVFGAVAGVRPALADEGDEPGAEPTAAAPAAASDASAGASDDGASSGRGSRKRRGKSRRSKHGAKFSGRVVNESELRTDPLPRPSGKLE